MNSFQVKTRNAPAHFVINSALLSHRRIRLFDSKHIDCLSHKCRAKISFMRLLIEITTRMRPHEEMYRGNSFQGQKTGKMKMISQWNCETKICKSSSLQLTEKLDLPIIQPTVIQALPNVQRTLPSLQATEKRCPPNSPSKERKTMPKPKSAVRRILPNLPPRMEDQTLPRIQPSVVKKVASSTKQLPILPTIEEQNLPIPQFPEAKMRTRVKRVRRVLPSIPQTEARTPPSIPPTEKRFQPSIEPTTINRFSNVDVYAGNHCCQLFQQ